MRHTYDARLTTTAEAVVVKDSDDIRVLSVGRLGFRNDHAARREQARVKTSPKKRIEAAAAAAAKRGNETSALLITFLASDQK